MAIALKFPCVGPPNRMSASSPLPITGARPNCSQPCTQQSSCANWRRFARDCRTGASHTARPRSVLPHRTTPPSGTEPRVRIYSPARSSFTIANAVQQRGFAGCGLSTTSSTCALGARASDVRARCSTTGRAPNIATTNADVARSAASERARGASLASRSTAQVATMMSATNDETPIIPNHANAIVSMESRAPTNPRVRALRAFIVAATPRKS